MSWNGLGNFLLDPAFSPEVNGNVIDAVRYNGLFNDTAAGIAATLNRDGENVPRANLPMGGYKHTGAALATAPGQYLEYTQAIGLGLAVGVIPQRAISADYTLVSGDAGYHIFHPLTDTIGRIWTIPANASVAFVVGTAVTFINQNAAGVITLAITTDVMRLAGSGAVGNRTLAANGCATAIKITSTEWIISGTGLT